MAGRVVREGADHHSGRRAQEVRGRQWAWYLIARRGLLTFMVRFPFCNGVCSGVSHAGTRRFKFVLGMRGQMRRHSMGSGQSRGQCLGPSEAALAPRVAGGHSIPVDIWTCMLQRGNSSFRRAALVWGQRQWPQPRGAMWPERSLHESWSHTCSSFEPNSWQSHIAMRPTEQGCAVGALRPTRRRRGRGTWVFACLAWRMRGGRPRWPTRWRTCRRRQEGERQEFARVGPRVTLCTGRHPVAQWREHMVGANQAPTPWRVV